MEPTKHEQENALSKLKSSVSTTAKMFGVGFMILILWIASFYVASLVDERNNRQQDVHREIATKWGESQLISGPIITVPYNTLVRSANTGQLVSQTKYLHLLPESLHMDVDIEPEKRQRGIFDSTVYTSEVYTSGTFNPSAIEDLEINASSIRWNEAMLAVSITDTRGISGVSELEWGKTSHVFKPGTNISADPKNYYKKNDNALVTTGSGIQVPIALISNEETSFSYAFTIRGSREMQFIPVGDSTTILARSEWTNPSFIGSYLPKSSDIDEEQFSATWELSSFGRDYPNAWVAGSIDTRVLHKSAFGVNLLEPVDFYTLTDRTTKYAILFIALTFLAFFLFEVISKIRIHPMQYILVGIALVLFYLLLLSFAENIGFLYAYIVAAFMTIGLIYSYSKSILKTGPRASLVGFMLLALYVYLYIVLQLEELALLFGSLLLFVVLAIVMRVTRNIDWYKGGANS